MSEKDKPEDLGPWSDGELEARASELVGVDRPDAELQQIALDWVNGRIYTDRHLPPGESLTTAFMALIFLEAKDVAALKKRPPGMIYEYLSEAGPRSVNGCPCFFSFRLLSRGDAEKVTKMAKAAHEAQLAAVKAAV